MGVEEQSLVYSELFLNKFNTNPDEIWSDRAKDFYKQEDLDRKIFLCI